MGAASPLTIYEDSEDDASEVAAASTDCASCARPLSPDDVALSQLLRHVNSSDVSADDIAVPEWGHMSVDDILVVRSVALPREQVDRPTMSRPQLLSDALLHAAALALFRFQQTDLEKFWMLNDHPMARLWRTLNKRPMRQHPRSQVVPASSSMAKGECIGISQAKIRECTVLSLRWLTSLLYPLYGILYHPSCNRTTSRRSSLTDRFAQRSIGIALMSVSA